MLIMKSLKTRLGWCSGAESLRFSVVAAVALAPPAQATNFGPGAGPVYYTDTAYQIHIYRWLGSTMTNSANYVRNNETAIPL